MMYENDLKPKQSRKARAAPRASSAARAAPAALRAATSTGSHTGENGGA